MAAVNCVELQALHKRVLDGRDISLNCDHARHLLTTIINDWCNCCPGGHVTGKPRADSHEASKQAPPPSASPPYRAGSGVSACNGPAQWRGAAACVTKQLTAGQISTPASVCVLKVTHEHAKLKPLQTTDCT